MFTAQVRKHEDGFALIIPAEEVERLRLRDGDSVTGDLTPIPSEIRSSLDQLLSAHAGSVPDAALHAWMLAHGIITEEGYAEAGAEIDALMASEHPA